MRASHCKLRPVSLKQISLKNGLLKINMIRLNVILSVKNEADIPEIRECLSQQVQLSRKEPGCLRFEVYHSDSDPKVFILNEQWKSEAALDQHRQARAIEEIYKPKVLPRVDRTPHVCTEIE